MKEFLKSSNSFLSIDFKGNYSMNLDDFISMFDYYSRTKINLLDDYSNMIYLMWESEIEILERQKLDKYVNSESRLRRSKLFSYDWLSDCRYKLSILKRNYINHINYLASIPRVEANKHIAIKSVRKEVFKLHGNKCLKCGETNNIQIDHVIPVDKGGINDLSNYQPLCKRCNVKKGTKIIDYRKNKR